MKKKTKKNDTRITYRHRSRGEYIVMLIENLALWNEGKITTEFIIELAKVINFQAKQTLNKETKALIEEIIATKTIELDSAQTFKNTLKKLTEQQILLQ